MASRRVKVAGLASPCLTRPRGEEAYSKLLPLIDEHGAVDLDLDSRNPPSTSFLDEIVLKLEAGKRLERVTFVTQKDRIRLKLAKIAAVRHLSLYFKPEPAAKRRLVPKTARSKHKAEYEQKRATA